MKTDGIYLDNLTLTYFRHPAVHHLNCIIEKGSWTAIVGPNGGGKSTLLKALAGLREINEGAIHWIGVNRKNIGYLGHPEYLNRALPLSVFDLVSQGLWPKKKLWFWLTRQETKKVDEALHQVGIFAIRDKAINELSPGQFQRALFARLIVQSPEVILMDEPFTALDAPTIETLIKVCQRWHKEKRTLIMVVHDLHLVKEHIPQTLLISKNLLGFGPTQNVLVEKKLNLNEHFHSHKNEVCIEWM